MSFVGPDDPTPRATAICFAAILLAVASIVGGGSLVSKTLCDGQPNVDGCGDPVTRPDFALGWLVVLAGIAVACILFVLGLIYREVIVARRYAELAALTPTGDSPGVS